jgi:hypothetical protein
VSIVIEAEPTERKFEFRTAFGPPADIIAGFDGILSLDADFLKPSFLKMLPPASCLDLGSTFGIFVDIE